VSDQPALLAPADLRALERLSLVSLKAIVTGLVGQREGVGRGLGSEFADYRRYTPGDDIRRIDWNIYRRLRELYIKAAPREARLWLSILLDTSGSMRVGSPSGLDYGRRFGALLGAIALLRSDTVQVHALGDGREVAGGRLDAAAMLRRLTIDLEQLPQGRTTELSSSVRAVRAAVSEPELAVLITDALTPPDDLADALAELARYAGSAALVHVFERSEADPLPSGDMELRDIETGQARRVLISDEVRQRYATREHRFREGAREQCRARGIHYVPAPTEIDPLELLLDAATSGELVGSRALR
jgi:uncharacterized protein (DUF58 family)